MKKTIIGLVAEIAAGKSTVTEYIIQKYNAKSARFSDCLRDILDRMYLEHTRSNMQGLSKTLREEFGQEIISQIMCNDIANNAYPIIIAEGIRRPTDTVFLKKEYKENFHIIYITADDRIRYERLVKRSENPDDQNKTWEEFQTECQKEAEQKIKEIAQEAKFVINNNRTLEELYKQIDKAIKSIIYAD